MSRQLNSNVILLRARIMQAIEDLHALLNGWPTQAQICTALGISRRTLSRHVDALVAEGRIERMAGGRVLKLRDPVQVQP